MMRMNRLAVPASILCVVSACTRATTSSVSDAAPATPLMSPMDLQALPVRDPDHRIGYGDDSIQHGDLRLPAGSGPHPVAVLIHGGCFKAEYATSRDLAPMGDALKDAGIATWNVEYRRVGHAGGGWPGTYLDVGRAVDHLRTLAREYPLDLNRVVVLGHSAGGHLATWVAARSRLAPSSPLYMSNPLPLRGIVNLAGPVDLTANIAGYETLCRDSVITSLMGGTPAAVAERYAQASPISLLPLGVPQVFIWGTQEDFVPRPLIDEYVARATKAGDRARLIVIPRAGHFESASPRASTWPRVEGAIRSLLEGQLPGG